MRTVIQIVNADELRVRILNVGYREAYGLGGLLRCSNEPGDHESECNRHERLIGGKASFR